MTIHLTEKAPPAFIADTDDWKLVHSTQAKAVIDGDGENFSGKQPISRISVRHNGS